jgi:hypothetical protein
MLVDVECCFVWDGVNYYPALFEMTKRHGNYLTKKRRMSLQKKNEFPNAVIIE